MNPHINGEIKVKAKITGGAFGLLSSSIFAFILLALLSDNGSKITGDGRPVTGSTTAPLALQLTVSVVKTIKIQTIPIIFLKAL